MATPQKNNSFCGFPYSWYKLYLFITFYICIVATNTIRPCAVKQVMYEKKIRVDGCLWEGQTNNFTPYIVHIVFLATIQEFNGFESKPLIAYIHRIRKVKHSEKNVEIRLQLKMEYFSFYYAHYIFILDNFVLYFQFYLLFIVIFAIIRKYTKNI